MSRLRGQTYMSLYIAFCSGLGHQQTKGADGSCYQSISVFIMVVVFANSIFFKNGSVGAVNNTFFSHV